jgi:hypothetical protein
MKPWLLPVLLALSACTNPMLATNMTFGTGGVAVNPTLSGGVGDATVIIAPGGKDPLCPVCC